ncbi:hypothetical protein FHS36_005508 [Streptomyces eurocidicus]|uniref:Uncharacterized protein n=1 Tax=Streptomyces eurocidicus TaxID=66423 RepID=A0A7W8BFN2_STREU|nr:hypothetical protein [Streptomyces eurocidicus]
MDALPVAAGRVGQKVLPGNAVVCEDGLRHNRPLCRRFL